MVVVIPADLPPLQLEAWQTASELCKRFPHGWTIVGGQMVQFHGWRLERDPERSTDDLDAGIDARAHPTSFTELTGHLEQMGFRVGLNPHGKDHRWSRPSALQADEDVIVDVLLPTNLGPRARKSSVGGPGLESRGVQWAIDMTEIHEIWMNDKTCVVPVPHLVGSMLAKASALLNKLDRRKDRHLDDLGFLCQIATPKELRVELTPNQIRRLMSALSQLDGTFDNDARKVRMAIERKVPNL